MSGCALAGMLAPDGRCKTLDAAAEGYVRAEAVGAVWVRCLKSVAGLTLGPDKPVKYRLARLTVYHVGISCANLKR